MPIPNPNRIREKNAVDYDVTVRFPRIPITPHGSPRTGWESNDGHQRRKPVDLWAKCPPRGRPATPSDNPSNWNSATLIASWRNQGSKHRNYDQSRLFGSRGTQSASRGRRFTIPFKSMRPLTYADDDQKFVELPNLDAEKMLAHEHTGVSIERRRRDHRRSREIRRRHITTACRSKRGGNANQVPCLDSDTH